MKRQLKLTIVLLSAGINSGPAFGYDIESRPGYSTLSTLHKLTDDPSFTPLHEECLKVIVKPKVTEQELLSVAKKLVQKEGEISGRLFSDILIKSKSPEKILRIWNKWRNPNNQTYWLSFVYFREVILYANIGMVMDDSKTKPLENLYRSLQEMTMTNPWKPKTITGKLMYLELLHWKNSRLGSDKMALQITEQFVREKSNFVPYRWFRHLFERKVNGISERSDDDMLFCLKFAPSNPAILFSAVSHFNKRRLDISRSALRKFVEIGDYQFAEEDVAKAYGKALGVKE